MTKTIAKNNTKAIAKTELKKQAGATITPKSLKINMQGTETAPLRELSADAFNVYSNIMKARKNCQNANAIFVESVAKLEKKLMQEGTLSEHELSRLAADKKAMEENRVMFQVYANVEKATLRPIYATFKDAYKGYTADIEKQRNALPTMHKALENYFATFGVKYNKVLKDMFMLAITIEKGGDKQLANGFMFKLMNEKAFCEKIVRVIIDIAISKKALTFTAIDLSADRIFETDIDTKVKTIEERPSTIEEYVQLFDEVGISTKGLKVKEDYEKAFERNANRMFIFNA